jgi:hypothetical protein
MSSLLVSEAMLLLVGVAAAMEMASLVKIAFSPQTLGGINFFLCFVALVAAFVTKTPDTVPVRRAIAIASTYLLVVWLYAMLAH